MGCDRCEAWSSLSSMMEVLSCLVIGDGRFTGSNATSPDALILYGHWHFPQLFYCMSNNHHKEKSIMVYNVEPSSLIFSGS
jgi:hypothetical protein